MLKLSDKIALVAMSNGLAERRRTEVEELVNYLENLGLKIVLGQYLYESGERHVQARVRELHDFYRDEKINGIFDISGGDLANETLSFLDFELIAESSTVFVGYSDLTTIINGIYQQTKGHSYLYQLRHLGDPKNQQARQRFEGYLFNHDLDLLTPTWNFVQGETISGILIGGNIRCLLKLAGTPYLPDFNEKILFLESFGGDEARITTYFHQLAQMGVFEKVSGVLLGTFTELEKVAGDEGALEVLKEVLGDNDLPLARTTEVGHGTDAKALTIGAEIHLKLIE